MRTNILTVPIHKIDGGRATSEQDLVAVEEPLEIRIGDKNVAITMRTPGHDDELAAGFLCTEGILENRSQIANISTPERNVISVLLAAGIAVDLERLERHFYMT